jgi:hypothetical protein
MLSYCTCLLPNTNSLVDCFRAILVWGQEQEWQISVQVSVLLSNYVVRDAPKPGLTYYLPVVYWYRSVPGFAVV